MRFINPVRLVSVILACLLFSSALAQDESRKERTASVSATDEAALRALAEEFYASYVKKDLDGFLRLWSAKAPELAARRQTMQKLFNDHEKIEVKSVVIRKMAVEAEKAKLRVEVEMSAIEVKTGKPAAGFGKTIRAVEGVKEEGAWRVWREAPAEEDLAAALSVLKTDDERAALLTAEKDLVTERLVREIIRHGARLRSQGDYPKVLAMLRLAQNIAEQIGDKTGVLSTLLFIGNVYAMQGNNAQALEHFQKSLALSEAMGNKAAVAGALGNIGNVHFRQGNYAQALEHFQKSLAISEALGDKAGINGTLNNIGNVHAFQGNYAQALEHYQKSLALNETLGDKIGISTALNNIGNIHARQGNYTQALEDFRKSLAMKEALGDKAAVNTMLHNIGNVHISQGDYAQALEYYQKSLALKEAAGDKAGVNILLQEIGGVQFRQGNYAQALENFQKCLALSEAMGEKHELSRALANIGNVHAMQGNNAQALEYYQKSLALREALGEKVEVSTTLSNIGNFHSSQGNFAQALEYYQKSLMQSEALGNKAGVSSALDSIGNVHTSQGNYAQALEHYQKSLAMNEDLGNKSAVCNTLIDMANSTRLRGNYAQALDFAGRATVLARQFGYPVELWHAENEAGQSYRALNQPVPARQAFEEAIAAIETLRTQVAGGEQEQQRSFENKLDPYRAMVELLVAENQSSEALAYAERAKARALLDVLRSGRVNVTKAMTVAEQERERGFNNHLVSLNTQITRESLRSQPDPARLSDLKTQLQKARLDYEAFQIGLYAAHPELKAQRGEAQPLTPEQARELLPDTRSAMLDYVVTDERTYLFALTANAGGTTTELKVYTLALKRKELTDRVARFRETLAQGSPGFRQPARELYDLLLKPAAAQLQGRTSLVIVPDGVLWELPFQALQPTATRYLIEDSAISYAPSLTALREMTTLRDRKKDSTGSQTLLAFGNPALGKQTIARAKSGLMDEKLDPLPEAERQVNVMRQIYGAANSKVYIGAEAREERAKAEAGSYRILHLATHGILNDSSPMYSHLVLAQAEGDTNEDGLLEAWEIMKLDLKADLTVLSACETARGHVGEGEGMIGLSWALFVAGCPTSVVSQWKVESASATELMLEFHRQLKSQLTNPGGGLSAARALREAALKLARSNQYRHPFYWAGFVVNGKGY
jgi:CHAT domain-containing protein/Tfp pilus assembly protein PilF